MDLKIAVISDLHCHNKGKNKGLQESYLLTDVPIPDNQNPLEYFRKFIKKKNEKGKKIEVDILIMPGDITNRCDEEGLHFGWDAIKEIATLVNAKVIIPTIGNHDVDSRGHFSTNPFLFIKDLDKEFPFNVETHNTDFWKNGFMFYEGPNYRILVLNSAFDHTDKIKAEHGSVSPDMLSQIEEHLQTLEVDKKKFNIAICHHHPIPHERHNLGTYDLMENGTQLVELLSSYDFQMIIHGHKHDPLIRYAPGDSNPPVVFSSGSFSAFKNLLLQGMYNTFHIISLEEAEKRDCTNQGKIETWFFTPSKGWDADVKNEYFLPRVGFGCRIPLKHFAKTIHSWFLGNTENDYQWSDFVANFEAINYMLPEDKKKLGRFLTDFKISLYPHFPEEPEIITFKRK